MRASFRYDQWRGTPSLRNVPGDLAKAPSSWQKHDRSIWLDFDLDLSEGLPISIPLFMCHTHTYYRTPPQEQSYS